MKRKGAPGAGADACRATGFLGSFPALYGVRTGSDLVCAAGATSMSSLCAVHRPDSRREPVLKSRVQTLRHHLRPGRETGSRRSEGFGWRVTSIGWSKVGDGEG